MTAAKTPGAPGKRSARTLAMQALYEADTVDHPAEISVGRLAAATNAAPSTAEFATELVRGVQQHQAEIDRRITEAAPLRPLDELAAIDRNILRVAIYELLFDNRAPAGAVINEAVELAKKFGSESSAPFLNGVLRTISASAA